MTPLEERFLSSYPILAGLGRAHADGTPLGNPRMEAIAPDQWRIICEACFGVLWNRPGLPMQQRSLATMSTLVALRRDDNLRGHLLSGLDVGLSAAQIVEMMLQLIYWCCRLFGISYTLPHHPAGRAPGAGAGWAPRKICFGNTYTLVGWQFFVAP